MKGLVAHQKKKIDNFSKVLNLILTEILENFF
jgi:hypothetical protein